MPTIKTGFHIQRGDDVQTPPKNDLVQTFATQSKSGPIEIVVLADGETGGSERNQLSQQAVQYVINEVKTLAKTTSSLDECLKHALENTHEKLLHRGSGETDFQIETVDLLVAIIKDNKIFIGNTGKITALLVRGNNVEIQTKASRANSFGQDARFFTEGVGPITLNPGDDLLLAGDGLFGQNPSNWNLIKKNEIIDTLKNETDLKRAAKRLVSYPLGRNVEEDISAAIIRYPKKERKEISGLLIPAILAVGLLVFALYRFVSAPAPVQDSGKAILEESSGLIFRVDPADDSTDALQGIGEIPATYSIYTGTSSSQLLVRGAELVLGPETNVLFRQLEVDAAGEENHVIVDVNTQSSVLLHHEGTSQIYTIYVGDNWIESGQTIAGAIGLKENGSSVILYCFKGNCSFGNGVEITPLAEGEKALINGAGSATIATISSEDFENFEEICPACLLR